MFIDIHAHAYRRPVPFVCRFCTAEELLKLYDEADIKCGFILPIVSPEIYFPQANEDIRICARIIRGVSAILQYRSAVVDKYVRRTAGHGSAVL